MTILKRNPSNVATVILAAGEGRRMQSALPKVMHELSRKPLIEYVVKAAEDSGVAGSLVVVASATGQAVQDYLGERVSYVVQSQQLGTGHAVAATEDFFKEQSDEIESMVVLYGDMPFISPQSIKRLTGEHIAKRNVLTVMTATVPNFEGTNSQFKDFGRIVRNSRGEIEKIVEYKDASVAEKNIGEVNTGFFCFDAPWLWSHLKLIRNSNDQGEYYLTDLVGLAIQGGYPISTVLVEVSEAIGVNTKEQLERLHVIN
ncbi:MAG: NTP transferase domain-containing protein [Candidatus Magasanikbacteria bacterium]|nr:NTP transferase domain-containing protein [Candidatus Magasanikbacteria bacterium]